MSDELRRVAKRDLIAAVRRWLRYAENGELALPVLLSDIIQDEVRQRSRNVAQKVISSE